MSFTIEQFQRAAEVRIDKAVGDTLDCWEVTDCNARLYADMDSLGLDLVERANSCDEDADYDDDTAEDKLDALLYNVKAEIDRWFDDYRDTLDITGFNGTVKAMEYLTAHPYDIQHIEEYSWFPAVTDRWDNIVGRKGPEDTIIAIANAVLYNRVDYMLGCLREDAYNALDSFTINDIEGTI